MKNRYIMACILFIAIGFAVVTTTLVINGGVLVGANNDDFDIYFSKVEVNGIEKNGFISGDKQIFFNRTYKSIGDKDILKYYITNGSSNYDARVSMNCNNGNNIFKITNSWVDGTIIDAKDTISGTLELELLNSVDEESRISIECEIHLDAIEKTEYNTNVAPSKVGKLFDLVDDKNNNNIADIGDEIAIGDEHFYIINNEDGEYKALAKYNLYIGYELQKIVFGESKPEDYNEYSEIANSLGYKDSYNTYGFSSCYDDEDNDGSLCRKFNEENEYGLYKLVPIDKNHDLYNKQSSLALGAHGGSYGKPEFPQIGIFTYQGNHIDAGIDGKRYNGFLDFDINNVYIPDSYNADTRKYEKKYMFKDNLAEYYIYLKNINNNVNSIDTLSLSDLDNIVRSVTGNSLPLDEWSNPSSSSNGLSLNNNINILGDLKDYLSNDYHFLWDTTYWLSTVIVKGISIRENTFDTPFHLFVDTLGNVCNGSECIDLIGAGLRPVINISFPRNLK